MHDHIPGWLQLMFYADYFALGWLAKHLFTRIRARRLAQRMRVQFERAGYDVQQLKHCQDPHFHVELEERALHD